MQKLWISLVLLMGIFSAAVADDNEIRDLDDFDRIEVSRGIEVLLSEGKANKAIVISEHMPLENIITEVSGSTLKITLTKMIFTEVLVQIRLDYVMLQKITAKNGAIVRANKALNLENFEIDADAGSLVEMNLNSEVLRVKATKGSVVKLQGEAKQLIGKSNTGSSIYASKIPCDKLEVSSGTGSNFYVFANTEIVAKGVSGGVVTVYGKPKNIEQSTSLGGKVVFKDIDDQNETPKEEPAKQA